MIHRFTNQFLWITCGKFVINFLNKSYLDYMENPFINYLCEVKVAFTYKGMVCKEGDLLLYVSSEKRLYHDETGDRRDISNFSSLSQYLILRTFKKYVHKEPKLNVTK